MLLLYGGIGGFGLGNLSFYLIEISRFLSIYLTIYLSIYLSIYLGLIYLPAVVAVGYYFEKKRALATGYILFITILKKRGKRKGEWSSKKRDQKSYLSVPSFRWIHIHIRWLKYDGFETLFYSKRDFLHIRVMAVSFCFNTKLFISTFTN